MHVVNLDWLSIYVDASKWRIHSSYGVRKEEYGTSVYKDMYTISRYGGELAVFSCNPRNSTMKSGTGIIKIINSWLYSAGLQRIVENLLRDFNLIPLSVSRVDICADFNSFVDYEDPQDFIRDFLAVKVWKMGKAKYKTIGQQSSKHSYQYLRFGSNTSDVAAYMYNKTQEFRDVKRKNYIEQAWEINGINPHKEVWRLEFSLKGNGLKFLNKTSGEFETKTLDMVLDEQLRIQLYNACFLKYWEFRYNDSQVRKDRMKPCNLLSIDSSIYQPYAITCSDETTRENKRMITAMERTYDEWRFKRQQRDQDMEKNIQKMVDFTHLEAWYAEKYGRKYVDMDFAEKLAEEAEKREADRLSPTLFDLAAVK